MLSIPMGRSPSTTGNRRSALLRIGSTARSIGVSGVTVVSSRSLQASRTGVLESLLSATMAVALAQLGVRPAVLGVVGDDRIGAKILDQARDDGVDITAVVRRPGACTGLIVDRQERLTDDDPLKLTAVVSEAALVRCARDSRVAADQLSQLAERAAWPNVELRVLPFDAGLHIGMNGPFSLLSFPDDLLADVAYQEFVVGGHVIDDQSIVSQLDMLFNQLRSQALAPNESLAVIAQLADQTHE